MATPQQQAAGKAKRLVRFSNRVQWFDQQVAQGLTLTVRARVTLAVQLLRDKVVINISDPVSKYRARGRTRVDPNSRSKPGEFPKADTTRLMKDIFWRVDDRGKEIVGIVGTTLDYGLILETKMQRSFLVRTLNEMRGQLTHILTAGPGGGGRIAGL